MSKYTYFLENFKVCNFDVLQTKMSKFVLDNYNQVYKESGHFYSGKYIVDIHDYNKPLNLFKKNNCQLFQYNGVLYKPVIGHAKHVLCGEII